MKHINKAAAPIRRRMLIPGSTLRPVHPVHRQTVEMAAQSAKVEHPLETAAGDPAGCRRPGARRSSAGSRADRSARRRRRAGGSQADDPKLKAARDEAAQNRIKAREAASEKDQLIQTLGKALGLVKDDDEQGKGPDAEALAAQVEKSQTEATEAARELAVYKAAATNGADPSKLLDSRSFLNSIKDVDHGDEKALGAAIKAAVDNNKSFASARVAGASTADTASGPGGGSTPKADMSLADAVAGHYNR